MLWFNIVLPDDTNDHHHHLRSPQAAELAKLVSAASEEVCAGVARRAKLRSAALAAVRVLELAAKDIGSDLAILLRQV